MTMASKRKITYRDFERLALNPEKMDGDSVFRLGVYTYTKDRTQPYGRFKIFLTSQTFHKTLESAVGFIRKVEVDIDDEIYVAMVHELPLDPVDEDMMFKRFWTFDGNGDLIDKSLCARAQFFSDRRGCTFRGRPKSMRRFERGDIVEYITSGCTYSDDVMDVRLGVVIDYPASVEDAWRFAVSTASDFNEETSAIVDGEYSCMGYVDDRYTLVVKGLFEDDDDKRVESLCMFRRHYPIDCELRSEMVSRTERYFAERGIKLNINK